jgi:hypothetical protein
MRGGELNGSGKEPWKGNLGVIEELIDRNYVGYDPSNPEPLRGPDGFKEFVGTRSG